MRQNSGTLAEIAIRNEEPCRGLRRIRTKSAPLRQRQFTAHSAHNSGNGSHISGRNFRRLPVPLFDFQAG